MEAVCVLMGEKQDWDTAKKVLGDSDFLNKLKKFEKYIKKEEYDPETVGRQSSAAKSLCMWTHAMDTYSKVAKDVAPKKAKLQEMNDQLAAANATLQEKRDALQAVLDQVAGLRKQLDDTVAEKDR